jgi:hypothetical protein
VTQRDRQRNRREKQTRTRLARSRRRKSTLLSSFLHKEWSAHCSPSWAEIRGSSQRALSLELESRTIHSPSRFPYHPSVSRLPFRALVFLLPIWVAVYGVASAVRCAIRIESLRYAMKARPIRTKHANTKQLTTHRERRNKERKGRVGQMAANPMLLLACLRSTKASGNARRADSYPA